MITPEADWHLVSDKVKRRKLQNQQNQRSSRQRRAQVNNDEGTLIVKQWSVGQGARPRLVQTTAPNVVMPAGGKYQQLVPVHHHCSGISSEQNSKDEAEVIEEARSHHVSPSSLQPKDQVWSALLGRFHVPHYGCNGQAETSTLGNDRLLTLIYYNVFRGLLWNMEILKLDPAQMYVDDYPSPFLPLSPTATSAITRLPETLRPTPLQTTVAHHPFLDIFPCPTIRNNVLRRGEPEDEELCTDLLGLTGGNDHFLVLDEGPRTGATLWGDPWDIRNWEVSEYLALKWAWLFAGAFELQEWTNTRRRSRGWKEIHFAGSRNFVCHNGPFQ